MSSFLYALAHGAIRRKLAVLIAWLAVLAVLGGAAATFGKSFDNSFTLPGTESQKALDSLSLTFPQVSGSSAQVIVIAPDGGSVRTGATRTAIETGVKAFENVGDVDAVSSPFSDRVKDVIAPDNLAAIVAVQLKVDRGGVTTALQDRLEQITRQIQTDVPGSRASVGGDAFQINSAGVSPTEGLGVIVALIVLFFTLGSLRAAGMPLLTALLGVGITMSLVVGSTALATVSATTPLLALMLGLAVGIDYALFITSRHRDQLRDGLPVAESIARAVATAGSAVVFAGLTVIIALCGLSVAGIPFLTTMGIAAAVGVVVAVTIALTLLPALLAMAGDKLRPRVRGSKKSQPPKPRRSLGRGWVRLVTKVPVVTIVVVIAALGALAWPAQSLRLSLPDNGTADQGTPARVTYDLVASKFGPGYNGPLIVSARIVGSDDPLGVMDKMADRIRALPGVASVPLATPNETADTGIIQVVPTTAPDAPATNDLVERIRALEPEFQADYGVPTAVTGVTAVQIDVSNRLGSALLPFGILVVGLSLVLLTMVFRSIAVPIKATLGYLLSVLASFGAVALVFEKGWFAGPLNVAHIGPVLSFLPILLMGILFGLAMDYEVFLVSRIREDFVHDGGLRGRPGSAQPAGDPHKAIETGFIASSRVVVAAAVIMFAVFAAFVPEGSNEIKTIAFGLAVGVFVDAFIVRMTLVPAVLALLGRKAWVLPGWLDRRLPSLDVEGEALAHQLRLAEWPDPDNTDVIYAERLTGAGFGAEFGPVDIALAPGQVALAEAGAATTALLCAVSGRMRAAGGEIKTLGQVLPQQASVVRRRTVLLDARSEGFLQQLHRVERDRTSILLIDHAEAVPPADQTDVASVLSKLLARTGTAAVVTADDPYAAEPLLPSGLTPVLFTADSARDSDSDSDSDSGSGPARHGDRTTVDDRPAHLVGTSA